MADQLSYSTAVPSRINSSAGPLAALICSPQPSAGAPVLLLVPGYTGSKEDFVPILDGLAGLGFVAIAIDLPGQYQSPGPDEESEYLPAALGAVVTSVVAQLQLDHQVFLLGHSFGGLVARAAVLNGAPVSGLILLCSGPAALPKGERLDALSAFGPLLRQHGAAWTYDNDRRRSTADPLREKTQLDRFLRSVFLATNESALLGMGHALLSEPDLTGALADVLHRNDIPVAVIAGAADDAWPLADQRQMAAELGTKLLLVSSAAHSPAIEAPPGLLSVMQPFLQRAIR